MTPAGRGPGKGPAGRGPGEGRGAQAAGAATGGGHEKLQGWFAGAVSDGWFTAAPEVTVDSEEILVVGDLAAPDAGASPDARQAAEASRIEHFREDTRERRMRIAAEAERRFRRKVSWGVRCGETTELFTTASVPVMTRLRMPERRVLDTLIAGGVARSRSDALAWCVRLVGQNEAEWIQELQAAFEHVRQARAKCPRSAKKAGEEQAGDEQAGDEQAGEDQPGEA